MRYEVAKEVSSLLPGAASSDPCVDRITDAGGDRKQYVSACNIENVGVAKARTNNNLLRVRTKVMGFIVLGLLCLLQAWPSSTQFVFEFELVSVTTIDSDICQLLHDLRTDFYGTLFCEYEMFTLKISFA